MSLYRMCASQQRMMYIPTFTSFSYLYKKYKGRRYTERRFFVTRGTNEVSSDASDAGGVEKTETDFYSWRLSIITIHYLQFSLILSANSRLFSRTSDRIGVWHIFLLYQYGARRERRTFPPGERGNWRLPPRGSLKSLGLFGNRNENGLWRRWGCF